jgi:hypothetical protein
MPGVWELITEYTAEKWNYAVKFWMLHFVSIAKFILFQAFIHYFNKYLLNAHYVPGIVLETENSVMNKTAINSWLHFLAKPK